LFCGVYVCDCDSPNLEIGVEKAFGLVVGFHDDILIFKRLSARHFGFSLVPINNWLAHTGRISRIIQPMWSRAIDYLLSPA
jgi:hypothetical protein